MMHIKQHLGYVIDIDGEYAFFDKKDKLSNDLYNNLNIWLLMSEPQQGCNQNAFVYRDKNGNWIRPIHFFDKPDPRSVIAHYRGPQIRHTKYKEADFIKQPYALIQMVEEDTYCKGIDDRKFCKRCRHYINHERMERFAEVLFTVINPEQKRLNPDRCDEMCHLYFSSAF